MPNNSETLEPGLVEEILSLARWTGFCRIRLWNPTFLFQWQCEQKSHIHRSCNQKYTASKLNCSDHIVSDQTEKIRPGLTVDSPKKN